MSFDKFQIQKQIVAIAITLALPWIGIPFSALSQTENFPNLPQPRFQDVAPTPSVETGDGGGTGALGAQSGSVDASGTVGGVIGNLGTAVGNAAANSPAGVVGNALGVGPGPSGTAVGNAQFGVAAFSNVTTGLMTALGFSIAVTGLIGLLALAISVAIGAMFGTAPGPGDIDTSPGAVDTAADAEHGDTDVGTGPGNPGNTPAGDPGGGDAGGGGK